MNKELPHVRTKNLNNCLKQNRYHLYHPANAVARAVSFLIPTTPTLLPLLGEIL
jgi:hypothetical protein